MRTLADKYAEATEWNLATLEELCTLKSSSKVRIERQIGICAYMVQACMDHALEVSSKSYFTRLAVILKRCQTSPASTEEVVRKWANELKERKLSTHMEIM